MSSPPPVRVRRRRSPLVTLLVVLLVLAVLAVIADRVGRVVAEQQISKKVQSSQDLDRRPTVDIEGFPFLTQVVANHYPTVHLTAQNLTVGSAERKVRLANLDARLHDVRTIDNFSGASVQTAEGTAMLSYAELSRALGVNLGYAGGGRVQASKTVQALGQSLTGTASADVSVAGGDELTFSAVRVGLSQGGVAVPKQVTDQFASLFEDKLSLRGLPFHLRIQQLVADEDGVHIAATARGLTLN
ncbi:MAG: DUF2993 domain-containing protein [Actinobacteria bacterium]|nr:DUF2993 domain-containing protein [Actinomycetota bacterium]